MSNSQALENYKALLKKVDEKFAEIQGQFPEHFACRRGCSGCCKPGLSVSAIEKQNIRLWLEDDPERAQNVRALAHDNPHQGRSCSLLLSDGTCSIYDVRPLICRSHGAPIKFANPDSKAVERDVCPLNFTGADLEQLPQSSFINVDTLNTILGVINQQFSAKEGEKRSPLTAEGLLS